MADLNGNSSNVGEDETNEWKAGGDEEWRDPAEPPKESWEEMIDRVAAEKKAKQEEAKEKELEEKNQQELDESLPVVQEMVQAAEDAVEAVGLMASPIMSDAPDDAGDSMRIVDEIEAAANDAQNKLTEALLSIDSKLLVARKYAPEIKKKAQADFTAMQQKLRDAQKRLSPFKNFKREFAQRVEAKKAVLEITEKFTEVELEVMKASMISAGAEGGAQMSEEDVKSAEGLVKPAQTGLATVGSMIDWKLCGSSGPMKEEMTELKARFVELKETLEKVDSVLKVQREGVTLQTIYATANEKIDKAEQAFEKCRDVELILTGTEKLPKDESEQAIKDSEAAAGETTREVSSAKNFLNLKMIEVKRFSKGSQEAGSRELKEMEKRCEELEKKVASFKSDTQDRKVYGILSEAVDGVVKAEVKCKDFTDAAKIFESDNLEGTTATMLRVAVEQTATADKECTSAIADARSVIAAKQKDAKDKDVIQGLSKLTQRIGVVQQEATKIKRIAATGDKLAKCMEVAEDGETKLKEVEAEVEKLVKISKPEDGKFKDETVMKLDEMSASTAKGLKTVTALVSTNLSTAPPAIKGILIKLAERCKAAQVKVDEVKVGTKEQRERVLSESYVKEAETKTKEVEAALEKAGEAEAPFLKGMEVLPFEKAQSSMAACEECASKVQDAISAARDFIATKNLEVKRYDPKSAKPSIDEFAKLTERINAGAQKLGIFKKDMEKRKKKVLVQEVITAVTRVETEVEKVKDAMKPIMEKDLGEMSTEEASAMMKSLETAENSAQSQASACGTMLRARAREAGADFDQIKELETRLAQARTVLAKAKNLGSAISKKIMAKEKALEQEVADKLKAVPEKEVTQGEKPPEAPVPATDAEDITKKAEEEQKPAKRESVPAKRESVPQRNSGEVRASNAQDDSKGVPLESNGGEGGSRDSGLGLRGGRDRGNDGILDHQDDLMDLLSFGPPQEQEQPFRDETGHKSEFAQAVEPAKREYDLPVPQGNFGEFRGSNAPPKNFLDDDKLPAYPGGPLRQEEKLMRFENLISTEDNLLSAPGSRQPPSQMGYGSQQQGFGQSALPSPAEALQSGPGSRHTRRFGQTALPTPEEVLALGSGPGSQQPPQQGFGSQQQGFGRAATLPTKEALRSGPGGQHSETQQQVFGGARAQQQPNIHSQDMYGQTPQSSQPRQPMTWGFMPSNAPGLAPSAQYPRTSAREGYIQHGNGQPQQSSSAGNGQPRQPPSWGYAPAGGQQFVARR